MQREVKAKARFRYLVDAWGTETLRSEIEGKLGRKLYAYTGAALSGRKAEHNRGSGAEAAELQLHHRPTSWRCVVHSDDAPVCRHSRRVWRRHHLPDTLPEPQIANIPNTKVPDAKRRLAELGYPVEEPYLKWATIACAGNFSAKHLTTTKTAKETIAYLADRFGSRLGAVVANVGFRGCPNGCVRHLTAEWASKAPSPTWTAKWWLPTTSTSKHLRRRLIWA